MRERKPAASSVRLPRPARGGWLFMLAVGLVLATLGGRQLARQRDNVEGWLALGGGLMLLSAALLVLAQRERSGELSRSGRRLELVGDEGLSVPLPARASRRLLAPAGEVVALEDDAGLVELGMADDDGETNALNALLHEAGDETAVSGEEAERLARLAGLRIERRHEGTILRWRTGNGFEAAALFGLVSGASALVVGATTARWLVLAVGLGIGCILALSSALGCEHRIELDEQALSIERGRFGRRRLVRRIALGDVLGVDAVRHLGMAGPGVMIRTEPFVARKVALAHPGTHVSTEGMSLAARVAVARILSSEIAKRRRIADPGL